MNLSESRQNINLVLKQELKHLYIGLTNFHKAFFRDILGLNIVLEAVFRKYTKSNNPLFKDN